MDSLLKLRRIAPNLGPVTVSNPRGKTGTDGIEHVLRRIDVIRADSSIASEVLANGGGVPADISEVDL